MTAICQALRKKKLPIVLKGGTALRLCYGLNRFSEDLDFDCAKPLKLDSQIKEVFAQLGKTRPQLRNPDITIRKDTDTVKRYRVVYAGNVNLKIETSLRGTPNKADIVVINGILTYRISKLIQQKLAALKARTAARDLHDVVFLYNNFFDDFGEAELEEIQALYTNQSSILEQYNAAYNEDPMFSVADLLHHLSNFIDLYEARNR